MTEKSTQNQQQTTAANCDVKKTRQAISDLYKNVTMAQNCIKTLLPYVEEHEVTKCLHDQVEQYDSYIQQLDELSETLNFDPTPAPKVAVAMANAGIRTKMLTDKSTTHVAKIMLQGTLNGIIDLYRLVKDADVHPDVTMLEKQILVYEESRLEQAKAWL